MSVGDSVPLPGSSHHCQVFRRERGKDTLQETLHAILKCVCVCVHVSILALPQYLTVCHALHHAHCSFHGTDTVAALSHDCTKSHLILLMAAWYSLAHMCNSLCAAPPIGFQALVRLCLCFLNRITTCVQV